MVTTNTELSKRIESGESVLIAELLPPKSADPGPVRAAAKRFQGKVHAFGVSDNREGAGMAALAAAALVVGAGVEPLLHVVTRDRNRTALVSDCLGAQALGIGNFLCTSGTHQRLSPASAAKNVFDLDAVQLLRAYAGLATDASIVGERALNGGGALCLGATASPFADPLELQVLAMAKKAAAGARFLITQPVYDVERFKLWWGQVTERGLHQQVAVVAGIRVLTDAAGARRCQAERPRPALPDAAVRPLLAASDPAAQRAAGIQLALDTIEQLASLTGLRGFELRADGDDAAALEVIDRARLGAN
jgi:methylenetetrahydrofolate reductase (NADPH)